MNPECIPCPPLCRTCRSLEDCTSCLFARLQNGTCVRECPINFELDESGITCTPNNTISLVKTLDEFKFQIIGVFVTGISIIICIIGILFASVCIYLRHSRNKIKIGKSFVGIEMNTIGSQLTQHSRSLAGSQESLSEADMTQLVIADLTRIEKRTVLGKGAFGIVYSGVWQPVEGEPVMVAIKELNQDAPTEDMQELIKEAVLLAKIRHMYLVRFYCICMARQLMVVNELVQGGSLLDYLKKQGDCLTPKIKLTFMQQIASGMNYLESRRLVHRDLASRNCLVESNELVKISDFGMSRILGVGEDQYISSGGKVPVRWMSLEYIFYKYYSHKSDVWSYGITVWEILTSAKRPYGNVKVQQLIEFLVYRSRLEQPINCSSILYQLLSRCWIDKPDNRISFEELSSKLQELLKEPGLYVYGDPDQEVRSDSRDSSVLADYEEIDEEVMAYLVTTRVQILDRDAINGKRGTLNYENLRENIKRTQENKLVMNGNDIYEPEVMVEESITVRMSNKGTEAEIHTNLHTSQKEASYSKKSTNQQNTNNLTTAAPKVPSGYLNTNPSLGRAPPPEYLNNIPGTENKNATSHVDTLYESLDPKTMKNTNTEYVNQERIDSKRSSPQKKQLILQNSKHLGTNSPSTIILDDSQYMDLDKNSKKEHVQSIAPQVSNREEIHEYEDIDEDTPTLAHNYSEADDIVQANILANSSDSTATYEYIRDNRLTSDLAELAAINCSHVMLLQSSQKSQIQRVLIKREQPHLQ